MVREASTPRKWLKRAKSNLAIARQPRTDEISWEDLCFEVQQAAEKALKAVVLAKGIKFRLESRSRRGLILYPPVTLQLLRDVA
jgi:HEPN domain-containing protein